MKVIYLNVNLISVLLFKWTTMNLLSYLLALALSAFVYLMFGAYMAVSAGLGSVWPLISFYLSIFTFSIFSWFHLFFPRIGAILLAVSTIAMFATWPALSMVSYFLDEAFTSGLIEFGIPLVLTILILFSLLMKSHIELNKYIKLLLAIPPFLLGAYCGGYFTLRVFW